MAVARSSAASRPHPTFVCSQCGWTTAKWVGRCGGCQEWGTVAEQVPLAAPRTVSSAVVSQATPIGDVPLADARAVPSGIGELDRVLGGGLVPGAVVLLAGEPGIGKSTLLLDVAAHAAREGRTALYVTGEESAAQVRLRAERIGAVADNLLLAAETDLGRVLGQIEATGPDLVVVDSVQTIASGLVDGLPGGPSQVREVASALIAVAKSTGVPLFMVGHVTKDGSVAGPRTLEHLVDVVCQFEGERHGTLRLVRAVKNRYGATDEVGCFELHDAGIEELADPSRVFVSTLDTLVPGTAVTVTQEGRRPLAQEIQALAVPSTLASPRRTTSGVDSSRLAMILAVLQRHLSAPVANHDIYVSAVGGARVGEPAADAAIALSVLSATVGRPTLVRLVAIGEVGLAGDLRPVPGTARRLAEAARLGYRRAIVPVGALRSDDKIPDNLSILQVSRLDEAARAARLMPGER